MLFLTIKIYVEIKTYLLILYIINLRLLIRKNDVIFRIFIKNNNVNNYNLFINIIL